MSIYISNISLLNNENFDNNLTIQSNVKISSDKIEINPSNQQAAEKIDGTGLWLSPAFTDCYAHIPELNGQWRGNLSSECRAAYAGGFSRIAIAPDCQPCIDSSAACEQITRREPQQEQSQALPIGALTQHLNGETLSPISSLLNNGCVAISQALAPMEDQRALSRAFAYASSFDALIMAIPFNHTLAGDACAADGQTAFRLGLPSMACNVETSAVATYLLLAKETGVKIHFPIITTAASVELIQEARAKGMKVSAGTAIQYLQFQENKIEGFNSAYRLQPPLRAEKDRLALCAAVNSGVLSTICSDHLPQESSAKRAPFPSAAPGMSNLQTVLSQGLELVAKQEIKLSAFIQALTTGPNNLLGLSASTLEESPQGKLLLIDPKAQWQANEKNWKSAAHNTPFWQQKLTGKVLRVL